MEVFGARSHRLLWAALGLTLWSIVLWTVWISQPLEDEVLVVVSQEQLALDRDAGVVPLAPVAPHAVDVVCGSPWDASAGPDEPLPVLGDGESYNHRACIQTHRDNRIVLGMNIVVVAAGFAFVILLWRRATPNRVGTADPGRDENQDVSMVGSDR